MKQRILLAVAPVILSAMTIPRAAAEAALMRASANSALRPDDSEII